MQTAFIDHRRFWWVPAVILLVEAYLFFSFANNFVTPYYPDNFDQTSYLLQSYRLFERLSSNGFSALLEYVRNPPATGFLWQAVAAMVFTVTGPTRLAALGLNFLAFAALQIVIFNYFREKGHWIVGIGAAGLLLAINSIFRGTGGLVDFRLDFAALCLYGIVAVLLQASDGLLNTRRVIVAAAVAALLAATRTITIVYLAGAVAGIGLVIVIRWWRTKDTIELRRLGNVTIFAAVLGVFCGTLVYARWTEISAYYVAGHLSGQGFIQSTAFGITDLSSHLTYYPINIWTYHFGKHFQIGLAIIALTALATVVFFRSPKTEFSRTGSSKTESSKIEVSYILLSFMIAPLLVIIANPSKSPLVGSIIIGPATVMAALLLCAPRARWLAVCASIALLILGSFNYLENYRLISHTWTFTSYFKSLNKLYGEITEATVALGRDPVIFVDHESKIMSIGVLQVMAYEMGRQLIEVQDPIMSLGKDAKGIAFPFRTVTSDEVVKLIASSDIVVLGPDGASSLWEGYKSFAQYRSISRAAMARDFDLVGKSKPGMPDGVVETYVRRSAKPAG